MTLYVAAFHDRHTDPVVRVFSGQDAAIAWAGKNFRACLAHPEGYREFRACLAHPEGYRENTAFGNEVVWSAWYTYEADHAWVERVELDDATDVWDKSATHP